ncbi:MAG: sensor histidine kinase [Nitrosopumilus sp. YT1]|nr:MAG: sensor histidine kinase [Nitrosopumilus sp. YT1]
MGTGLGLPFCKKIIEQHKGTISVSSNPTTFTIKLPTNDLTMIKLPVN